MTESAQKTTPPKAEAPEAKTVSANPALIDWPTDKWGYLSKMKKEFVLMASTINGQDDKHELVLATLKLMYQHVQVRFQKDKTTRANALKQSQFHAADRIKRGLR
jgi:hypothetical protein